MGFEHTKLYWYLKRKQRKKNIRTDGHSQYGQDRSVFELLERPANGVFLDIGANDGISFSNSLFFEEKGWTGICVEPHPLIFKTLQEKRKCHLVNACISDQDETVDFLVVEGRSHMLSGIDQFLDDRHRQRIDREIAEYGGSKRIIEIEALSLASLLGRFSIGEVDYLSIDTEGCELPILRNFDFETTHVKTIGVENGTRSPDIFRYLTSVGYRLAKCVGCDEIYIRK
jgi:FkbM family methyltransferase